MSELDLIIMTVVLCIAILGGLWALAGTLQSLSDAWLPVIQAYLEAKANQRPMVVPDPPDIGPPKLYRPNVKDPVAEEDYL